MKHTARTVIALTIVLFSNSQLGPDPAIPGPTPVEIPQVSTLTVVGASPQQQVQLDEALTTFESAGLALPPLMVEFHESDEPCGGNAGYYWSPQAGHSHVHRIAICHRSSTILLHELAHAWDHHNTSEDSRKAFIAHWGLERWNDHDDDWHDRAGERAADTVAHTLGRDKPTHDVNILRYICGFEVLTGLPIPEVHQQACDSTPEARYLAESELRPPFSS